MMTAQRRDSPGRVSAFSQGNAQLLIIYGKGENGNSGGVAWRIDPAGENDQGILVVLRLMDKTIRRYNSFAAMKDDEYREWQALPAHVRLDAAGELSSMLYQWKQERDGAPDVQPGLQRTLIRLQRTPR
jgi:hypothetical protein